MWLGFVHAHNNHKTRRKRNSIYTITKISQLQNPRYHRFFDYSKNQIIGLIYNSQKKEKKNLHKIHIELIYRE